MAPCLRGDDKFHYLINKEQLQQIPKHAAFARKMLDVIVTKYVKRSGLSYAKIAERCGLTNKATISNWVNGYSRKPRDWRDLVSFAAGLGLNEVEANEILHAAGHPTIGALRDQASHKQDRALLERWPAVSTTFQVPRLDAVFVGRSAEIQQIQAALITDHKLCLVHGMGGVGKSTIAKQVAHQVKSAFPDGVVWCHVNGVGSVMGILHQLGKVCERDDVVAFDDVARRGAFVRGLLAQKRMLIILDDVAESAELTHLLPTEGHCAVLITSRNQHLKTALPKTTIGLQPLPAQKSRALLTAIVEQARLDNQQAADELLAMLAGLPLALRIAAHTLRATPQLTLAAYVSLLRDERQRLALLVDWDDPQVGVQAAFEISYRQLSERQRQLFATLGTFPVGRFSAEIVSQLIKQPQPLIAIALNQLAGRSLLTVEGHFQMHTLISVFAREKLGNQIDPLRQQLIDLYITTFEQATQFSGLDDDWVNVQPLTEWAQQQDVARFRQLVQSLTSPQVGSMGYLDVRGEWRLAVEWLDQTESAEPTWQLRRGAFAFYLSDHAKAKMLLRAADSQLQQAPPTLASAVLLAQIAEYLARIDILRDVEEAATRLEEAIGRLEQYADDERATHLRGYLHIVLGRVYGSGLGMLDRAKDASKAGLALVPTDNSSARLSALLNLSTIFRLTDQLDTALTTCREAVTIAEAIGDQQRLDAALNNLGTVHLQRGELGAATEFCEKALEIARKRDDVYRVCARLINLGVIQTMRGEDDSAEAHLCEAIDLATQNDEASRLATAHTTLGNLYIRQMRLADASAQLAAAQQLGRDQGVSAEMQPAILYYQAEVALRQHELEKAESLAKMAIGLAQNLEREHGIASSVLGQVYDRMGRLESAEVAHQTALTKLQETDRYEFARAQLAYALHRQQQHCDISTQLDIASEIFNTMGAQREITLLTTIQHAKTVWI